MKIDLEVEEEVEITIEQACEYIVWGERNEEGTMIIKWRNKNSNHSPQSHALLTNKESVVPSQKDKTEDISKSKGCGKKGWYPNYHNIECGKLFIPNKNEYALCPKCSKKSESETEVKNEWKKKN